MVDAVDLGALLKYKQHVMKLHDRYSAKVWAIIYQADVRCRLEHMERTRRQLQALHQDALAKGTTTDYDDARPWNLVWQKVVPDETFWRDQVLEPALLVLTRVAGLGEVVDGDSGAPPAPSASSGARDTAPHPARMGQAPQIRPRNSNRTGRFHQIEGGKYTMNRTGYKICGGYNPGECTESSHGIWCSRNNNEVHLCDRCLGAHPSSRCPHQEMPTPSFVKGKGGKGRSKSKNRGKGSKGKGRQPY